ncbi:hypothetical protein FRX31_013722 [Thalictrum thalictroides]|uniref:Uncharacterized protein n=1 Tax=Thalictrum thalictroides TaxID=46969 RepID=A0A7J6WKS1_THATH|nr:hypothetical protein FRX31_013722 [Thalictrum thalictroides]
MEAAKSREARRKRILEKGSDRLALITGRIDSLPEETQSQLPGNLLAVSLPAEDSSQLNLPIPPPHSSNATSQDEGFARRRASIGSIRNASIDTASSLESELGKCETRVDTTKTPVLDRSRKLHPDLIPSTALGPSDSADDESSLRQETRIDETHVDAARVCVLDRSRQLQPALVPSTAVGTSNSAVDEPCPRREAQPHFSKLFTANKISSTVTASENIRIITSITIAVLVVLSHLRVPLLSSYIIAAILTTRPVYLVLLTDVTIVVAQILSVKQVVSEKMGGEIKPADSEDEHSGAEGLGTLEAGLMLYKAVTAAFMDCSVYLVVVICGLSLLRG